MPFQFTPYTPDTRSILELMSRGPAAQAAALRASGDARARAMEISGQARAQAAQSIGQSISGSIGDLLKQREEAPYRAAQIENMRAQAEDRKIAAEGRRTTAATNQTIDTLMKDSLTTDPTTGATTYDRGKLQQGFTQAGIGHLWPQYSELVDKSDASVKTLKEAHHTAIKDVAALVDAAGNDATVFTNELMRGVKNGLFTEAEAQPLFEAAQRDPTHVAKITSMVLGKKPGEGGFTLGEGQKRFDVEGTLIAEGAAKPASYQQKDVLLDGKPAIVSYDPATGNSLDAAGTNVTAHVRPIPPASVQVLNQMGGEETTATAKLIADYKIAPPSARTLATPAGEMLMSRVLAANPAYDSTMFGVRAPTRKAFTTGTQGQQITAMNTAIEHLDMLQAAADALANGSFKPGNQVYNAIRDTFGSAAPSNYDTIKQMVDKEVEAVANKGVPTVSGTAEQKRLAGVTASPAAIKGYIDTLIPLMGSKLNALHYQYKQAMGADDPWKPLTPEAEGILTKRRITIGAKPETANTATPTKKQKIGRFDVEVH